MQAWLRAVVHRHACSHHCTAIPATFTITVSTCGAIRAPCVISSGEDIVEAAGKMGVLDRLLSKLKGRGHRVTLFSQYNRMLDIIEDYLLMRGYRWVKDAC